MILFLTCALVLFSFRVKRTTTSEEKRKRGTTRLEIDVGYKLLVKPNLLL